MNHTGNSVLYTNKMLEEDLKYNYCENDEKINTFIRKGYNTFYETQDVLIPTNELSESVLSESVLNAIKVKNRNQLKYIEGSFLILKNI